MKISESWLREWVEIPVNTSELVAQLTMAGLEVDAVEDASPDFNGVLVGCVLSVEKHPNADNLKICQVQSASEEVFQVVCGAENVRQGIKVPFAIVGARLPGGVDIKLAKLRDAKSFGMLCGADELGLAVKSNGLLELPVEAPTGTDFYDYLKLNDKIIDIDLTPNRGDCLSIRGVAREAATLNLATFSEPSFPSVKASITDALNIQIEADTACPRYIGRVIKNVNTTLDSPLWLQEKLRRSGLRATDIVVDVTNYVMLELGQPMHAFDLKKLCGGIVIRMAKEGEGLKLLDGSDAMLTADTLVVCDEAKVIAIAGIMGSKDSSVSSDTRDIFLESAYFSPIAISGRPRSYGKHTDASHRFERGVDPELQEIAIERATVLLLEICGGEAGPISIVESQIKQPSVAPIVLRHAKLEQQLGLSLKGENIEDILGRLGLGVIKFPGVGWRCSPPSWRFDLSIEADLIEEVARIYGYENLPTAIPSTQLSITSPTENLRQLPQLRNQLIARGYFECITYSFVDPEVQSILMPTTEVVPLVNPISSDMSVMRTTLWSGLLPAVRYNLNRQQERVRLFETGLIFSPGKNGLVQESMISGVITGSRMPDNCHEKKELVDFFDLKGDVQSVLNILWSSRQFEFVKDSHPCLHSGQSAKIMRNGQLIGWLGQIHPTIQKNLDLSQPIFVFELQLQAILKDELPQFSGVSKFPEVRRDLAFIVDEHIT
ncbi:MAG: phenylalanyl-tRNA synthetase beta chain, partial [Saprospiraceae bacterium]